MPDDRGVTSRSTDPAIAAAHRWGTTDRGGLALVLSGGGARGAYQVGVLRAIARAFPGLRIPILTGVSAGAINAAHLANHPGPLSKSLDDLAALWCGLTPERIFRVDVRALVKNMGRWGFQLAGGGVRDSRVRGLVDTAPLWDMLREALGAEDGEMAGVARNLARGTLRAVALGTTDYTTGQSIVFVQGESIETWERPQRKAIQTELKVEHVMASSALPLFFPAVQIGTHWHGDGGVRLTAPLSPALHLGAHKILTVSNRYDRTAREASAPATAGYPPPAQVLGVLYDAVFLDVVDQDVARMERMNILLDKLPPERRDGMRPVEVMVIRPSRDLSVIAREYEPRLPHGFRLLTRGLGTRETRTPDVLSLVMFQDDYARRLISLGEEDAEARMDEIAVFLDGETDQSAAA